MLEVSQSHDNDYRPEADNDNRPKAHGYDRRSNDYRRTDDHGTCLAVPEW
jgi:hypothetical protein